jgi:hypothetical protein
LIQQYTHEELNMSLVGIDPGWGHSSRLLGLDLINILSPLFIYPDVVLPMQSLTCNINQQTCIFGVKCLYLHLCAQIYIF